VPELLNEEMKKSDCENARLHSNSSQPLFGHVGQHCHCGWVGGGVEGAASLTLTQETFKKEWEGDVGNLMAADLAMASGSGKLRSLEAMSRKT
jgi:hypothetical protein